MGTETRKGSLNNKLAETTQEAESVDIYVYGFLNIIALMMGLFTVIFKSGKVFAMFAFFGAIISVYTFLGVGGDGNLTVVSNGANFPIISNSAQLEWTGIVLVPLMFALLDFILSAYRGLKGKL